MIEVDHGSFIPVPSEQPGDEQVPSFFVRPLVARHVSKLRAITKYEPPRLWQNKVNTRFAHIFAAYDAQNQIIGYCAIGRTTLKLEHATRAPIDGELIRVLKRLASDRKQFALVVMEEMGKEAAFLVDAKNEHVAENQDMKMAVTNQFTKVNHSHTQHGLF